MTASLKAELIQLLKKISTPNQRARAKVDRSVKALSNKDVVIPNNEQGKESVAHFLSMLFVSMSGNTNLMNDENKKHLHAFEEKHYHAPKSTTSNKSSARPK